MEIQRAWDRIQLAFVTVDIDRHFIGSCVIRMISGRDRLANGG